MGSLIARAALGFGFLMLAMALALLLSAGSPRYWQAWVFLGVFAGCTLPITLYLFTHDPGLLARRTQAGPAAETQASQKLIQSAASVCFVALFVVSGLDRRYRWSNVSPAISLLADVFVTLGFLVVFLVFKENSFTSATIEVTNGQTVVSTGPYRVVRHPMYAGAALLVLSAPIALGSLAAVPVAVILIAVIAVRAVAEERYLRRHLAGYDKYCEEVRSRIVPFIW